MTPAARGPALLTDQYELTMVSAALSTGHADRQCVFEVFGRRLPGRRRFGVVAGTGRLLDELREFTFDEEALSFLRAGKIVDDAALEWLAGYRFTGDIDGYPEGECYFPGSPILVVRGTFAEAVVLETLALSILNHDTAIATAAARMWIAAGSRPLVEMGSRRTHEQAAVAAARAAYIAGFTSTSNLEAGRRYGIPTTGTAAHSFTLLHSDERAAFAAQVAALGVGTTLLVDTYDVAAAVRMAVEIAGPGLGAVRIDSGDIGAAARDVRAQLDELGARDTKILVSGDLDEFAVAGLAAAPVDAYGVGTQVVTGSGAPTAELVYKLVARADRPGSGQALTGVAKNSAGKPTHKGRKWALRRLSETGVAEAELLSTRAVPAGDTNDRPLLVPMVRGGEVVYEQSLLHARERLSAAVAELPRVSLSLSAGDPAIDTTYLEEVRAT